MLFQFNSNYVKKYVNVKKKIKKCQKTCNFSWKIQFTKFKNKVLQKNDFIIVIIFYYFYYFLHKKKFKKSIITTNYISNIFS